MTVYELILLLIKCNPNAKVVTSRNYEHIGEYHTIKRAYEISNDTESESKSGFVYLKEEESANDE
ncbi:hypothetical protein [Velocimicrobium porci]|uniref:Uncharacterized protein n=1 Tax=Velocimicrobium porci TaxID=2606634 RepID=A0A6L5Y1H2_9FIRM|nr:hypothetical protein [Velocimicrobium porci]MSS64571.1 hypothetical protein [Velocimicrobium porci]